MHTSRLCLFCKLRSKRLEYKIILIPSISLRAIKLNIIHRNGNTVKKSEAQAFTAAWKQDIFKKKS
jgi:hypothetical protein